MLPNHSPLVVAEQFGTLESLYPGRIDLGLGRAPGTDPLTARALRRHQSGDAAEAFPQDVLELMHYFAPRRRPGASAVRAVPGARAASVPVWILGSSLFGAQLAAALGLPYAFASHFAPAQLMQAIELYRARFKPSEQLDRPYVMLGFNVFAADTDEEARCLVHVAAAGVREPAPRPPGAAAAAGRRLRRDSWRRPSGRCSSRRSSCSAVGSPETVRRGAARTSSRAPAPTS